jgi:hypothetical protein
MNRRKNLGKGHAYFPAKAYQFVIGDFVLFRCSNGFASETEILDACADCFILVFGYT